MIFTMLVTLFTYRIILNILGAEEYGIYQTVGGMVIFISFVNNALSTASSRFLTYELGAGDKNRLHLTFSTTLTIHILLALLIVIIAETLGLWFLKNKLVIPQERLDAAIIVYHLSVLNMILTITQVPYNASIIAHEKMSIYAYVSFFEVIANLIVAYLLKQSTIDKLIAYASLLCIVKISLMMFYRIYCTRYFEETKYRFVFNFSIFRSIAQFSGWSLFAATSKALNSQGIIIILNMFFSPSVVAARAISLQVNVAVNSFVSNFRKAVNPQIVKQYASGNFFRSKQLLIASTKYSFYLMLIFSFPVCLLAEPILNMWLTTVPEYTTIFLRLIIVQSLFQVFDSSFYIALYAKGQLRENALISPTILFLTFPVIYLFFKMGFSPILASWTSLIAYSILGLIIKPVLLVKYVEYQWKDMVNVYLPCFYVTFASLPVPIILFNHINTSTFLGFSQVLLVTVLSVLLSIYYLGFSRNNRSSIVKWLKVKLVK